MRDFWQENGHHDFWRDKQAGEKSYHPKSRGKSVKELCWHGGMCSLKDRRPYSESVMHGRFIQVSKLEQYTILSDVFNNKQLELHLHASANLRAAHK